MIALEADGVLVITACTGVLVSTAPVLVRMHVPQQMLLYADPDTPLQQAVLVQLLVVTATVEQTDPVTKFTIPEARYICPGQTVVLPVT